MKENEMKENEMKVQKGNDTTSEVQSNTVSVIFILLPFLCSKRCITLTPSSIDFLHSVTLD